VPLIAFLTRAFPNFFKLAKQKDDSSEKWLPGKWHSDCGINYGGRASGSNIK
jgi:hypothetical protein